MSLVDVKTTHARYARSSSGLLLAIAAAVALSSKAIFVKLAYRHGVTPLTLTGMRMAFALPVFLAIAAWLTVRSPVAVARKDKVAAVALGCLGHYVAGYLDLHGLQHVPANVERLILFLYPTLAVLLSRLVLRTPLRASQLAAMGLSYAGIAILFAFEIERRSRPGDLLFGGGMVFASALAYATYLVCGDGPIKRMGSLRFSAYSMTAACVVAIASSFGWTAPFAVREAAPVWGYAMLLGVVCTAVPAIATIEAIRRIGPGTVAQVGPLGPIVTIVLAAVFLKEHLSLFQCVGIVLVLAGVMLLNLRRGS